MSFITKITHFFHILFTFDLASNVRNSAYIKYNPSLISRILFTIKFSLENIGFIWKISSSSNKIQPRKKSQAIQTVASQKSKRYNNLRKNRKRSSTKERLSTFGRQFNMRYIFNRKVFYTAFVSLLVLCSVFIGYGFLTNPTFERDEDRKTNQDIRENKIIGGNKYAGLALNFDEQIQTGAIENVPSNDDILKSQYNRKLENAQSIVIEQGAEDIIEEGMPEVEKNDKIVEYTNYKIKKGDTISELAVKHKISEDALFSANVNVNSKSLKIGDTLRIPNKNGLTYKIRRNDTLSDIAVLFDTTVAKIVAENELKNSVIHPDTELFISSGRLTEDARLRILGIELINPVRGYLTSKYGFRIHPIYKTKMHHNGIDIAGNSGQNVMAAQSGTVIYAGWSGGYGYQIKIQHQGGLTTTYAHLASMSVKKGQKVKRAQTIGKVGSTGNVTGAHLHFEVLLNGKFVNPRLYVTY